MIQHLAQLNLGMRFCYFCPEFIQEQYHQQTLTLIFSPPELLFYCQTLSLLLHLYIAPLSDSHPISTLHEYFFSLIVFMIGYDFCIVFIVIYSFLIVFFFDSLYAPHME